MKSVIANTGRISAARRTKISESKKFSPMRHGLKRIKKSGGLAMVQDPEAAEVDTMPRAAARVTEVDYVLPLEEIGPFLNKLTINPPLNKGGRDHH